MAKAKADSNGHWRNRIVGSDVVAADQLLANPYNWRIHPKYQQEALAASLGGVGWVQEVVVNRRSGHVIDGHLRVALAISKGESVPVKYVDLSDDEERLILATLDPLSAMAATDRDMLEDILSGLRETELVQDDGALDKLLHQVASGANVAYGEYTGVTPTMDEARRTLAERFIVPPFSVLDARQGYWQARKAAWIALGIQSELGRGAGAGTAPVGNGGACDQLAPRDRIKGKLPAAIGGQPLPLDRMKNGRSPARKFGQDLMRGEHVVGDARAIRTQSRIASVKGEDFSGLAANKSGTSIFDPVLCECAYRWFCPPGGTVLDPFAGGSVRGIVAAILGRRYVGIDLRLEQVAANEQQAVDILAQMPQPSYQKLVDNDAIKHGGIIGGPDAPRWIVGDSRNLDTLWPDEACDFVFTCPPYFDLEIYSDDPADLSNADDYQQFVADYRSIVAAAVARLRPDRFAAVVVGDIRDKRGLYRNFVSDTIAAFQDAGAALYNEAVLVTVAGSLPVRVGKQFESGRKLGKTHQNVLVFVKGDWRKAVEAIGPTECGDVGDEPVHSRTQ